MNSETLLICACALLAVMLFVQSCWMKSDEDAAELAVAQLEYENQQLQNELDNRDALTFRDLLRAAAAQDAAAETEEAPLVLVG